VPPAGAVDKLNVAEATVPAPPITSIGHLIVDELGGGGFVGGGGFSVTVAWADFVVSATEVAITITLCVDVIVAGAWYNPEVETVPNGALNDQVTPVFVVPPTVGVKDCVCDGVNEIDVGFKLTDTTGVAVSVTVA
jgi:hypothetical protein